MKSHFLKATGLLTGVQTLGVLATVVRTKLTALLIGTAGVGLANYFNQGIFLLSNTTGMGLSFSAVQRLSRLYERERTEEMTSYVAVLRSWSLLIALFGTLVCMAIGPLMSLSATGTFSQTALWFWLSPAIGVTILLGTETAILKGTRRLKSLAVTTGGSTFTTLIITVTIYWQYGLKGVVPTLVLCLMAHLLLTFGTTLRQFPYRTAFRHRTFRNAGRYLFGLGIAYMGAGLVGSGADMLIATLLMRLGNVQTVGLYAAGFTLTVSYVRLIFSAVDADYFPRLSAVMNDGTKAEKLANEQIVVLLAFVSPCIIGLASILPWLVPLLYTSDFLIIVPMVACAMLSMFFKAIYTPVAYYPLARAESKVYFAMETLYYVALVVAVIGGFIWGERYGLQLQATTEEAMSAPLKFGLIGAGIGISVANFLDFVAICATYHRRYNFHFEKQTLRHIAVQFLLVVLALLAVLFLPTPYHLIAALNLGIASVGYAWQMLVK